MADHEKATIPTAEIRAGYHGINAPGLNLPVDIVKVERDATYTYLHYQYSAGMRTIRKVVKRKTAGRSTVLLPSNTEGK